MENALPARAVVLARIGFAGKSALRNANQGAGLGGSELPANNRGELGILVPIGEPTPDEQTGRIDSEHLAVAVKDHFPVLFQLLGDETKILVAFRSATAVAEG